MIGLVRQVGMLPGHLSSRSLAVIVGSTSSDGRISVLLYGNAYKIVSWLPLVLFHVMGWCSPTARWYAELILAIVIGLVGSDD